MHIDTVWQKILGAIRESPLRISTWMALATACAPWPAAAVNMIELGSGLNADPAQDAQACSLAVCNDVPYVAWSEAGVVGARIFVKHWNGSDWEQDGDMLNEQAGQWAEEPSLAFLGPAACVGWSESTEQGYQVHVKRLEGSGWQPLGASGMLNRDPTRSARQPSLAAYGTRLYAAWSEDNGRAWQVYAGYYEGGAWLAMGDSLNCNPALSAGHPSLAVSDDGRLAGVAWEEGGDVFVKRWNGSAWELAGSGRLNVHPASNPCLSINAGRVACAAWMENQGAAGQIYVKFLAGSLWQPMGGSLNLDPQQAATSPALLCAAGTTQAAWVENRRVHLKRFREGGWQTEGECQNRSPDQPARSPRLALNNKREPYFAWIEDNGTAQQVRAKKWPQAPLVNRLVAPATPVHTACPVFELSGTNDYNSQMRYRIEVGNTSDFSTILRTFDQTLVGSGWSAVGYYSGATASYAMQAQDRALSPGRYFWRAYAYDMTYDIWSPPSASVGFQIESVAYPAPVIRSQTHPDPARWYSGRKVTLTWDDMRLGGVYHYLFDDNPGSLPQAAGATLTACSIALEVPADGVWYFHLSWQDHADPPNCADTSHFAVRVDTSAPRLLAVSHEQRANKLVRLSWSGDDAAGRACAVSGLAGYGYAFDRSLNTVPAACVASATQIPAAEFDASPGGAWYFHLRACDQAGNWSQTLTYPVRLACSLLPAEQVRCLPNPIRSQTARIRYYLREAARVRLEIFTAMERRVRSAELLQPAAGTCTWDGDVSDLPNGIYFYRLRAQSLAGDEEAQVVEKMAVAR